MKTLFSAENNYWLSGTPKTNLFVYFELQAPKFEGEQKRVPLNISLVIDHSGSMEGEKLAYAKKAVDFVTDNLTTDDFLSIVQYDNVVEVVSPSSKVTNKASLHTLINKIEARGMTNLSGGMLEGYSQVVSTQEPNYVHRVLLLSDGLANEGVTEPTQLQKIAQQRFRENGIALSTFGVGADFNELLMTNLSEHGGGNYYFIGKPDEIPAIFAKELSGLLSVVAQNTKVGIKFPENHLKFTKAFGYPVSVENNSVQVNFNDVFSEEKKAILLKFEVIKPFETLIELSAVLKFDDVVTTFNHQTHTSTIQILPTHDKELFSANVNKAIIAQVALFEANEMFEQAILKADSRDFDGAKQVIAQIKMYLEAHFQLVPADDELKKQYEAILAYGAQLDEMANMDREDYLMSQKSSRSSNYEVRKKK